MDRVMDGFMPPKTSINKVLRLKTGDYYVEGAVRGKNAFNATIWTPFTIRFQNLRDRRTNVYYVKVGPDVLMNKRRVET